MFKDKEEELKRLEQQLLEEEPEDELPEDEAWEDDEPEDEEGPPVASPNRGLLITVLVLTFGVLGVLIYILFRFGGLL